MKNFIKTIEFLYKERWKINSYTFIFLLLTIILGQLDSLKNLIEISWIKIYQPLLILLAITSGFLTFWHNRQKLETEINKEKEKEKETEEKRRKEFSKKFPKIIKIPVLKDIIIWFYQNGIFYSFTVLSLFITGFIIRVYKLGKLSLWWDELITGTYVTKILEIGAPLFPSELGYYWRGVAYHYFVSLFTFLFGNNEFWLRFPSVLFGMGIILITFIITKKINKRIALLTLFFLIFSSYNIEYSRFARFYIMNSFLFMLGIWFFWKGFFENNLKYKISSLFTFFLMLHTVQFGAIFVSLIPTWFLFFSIELLNSKNRKILIKKNYFNFFLFFIFFIIYKLGNIFEKFIKIDIKYPRAIDIVDVAQPINRSFFQIPNWYLIDFFNNNYFPIIIIFFCAIISIYFFINNKNKNCKLISFIFILTLISTIIYEIGSRDISGARIFIHFEALIVILLIISFYYLFSLIFTKNKIKFIFTLLILILLLFNIKPLFYKRININYGNSVINDPFRTTSVATYRSDYKNTFEYVEKNKGNKDIIITVMTTSNFYLKDSPDYIFNQNIRWNTEALIDTEKNFINKRFGSVLINSSKDIENIIDNNKSKKIWLIVNGGSINIKSTIHIREDFLFFLERNKEKIIYESPDGFSKVLVF